MPETGAAPTHNPKTAFERSDISVGALALVAVGVLIWLAVVPYLLSLGYPDSLHDALKAPTVTPPAPRLQTDPQHDLAEFRAEKRQLLTGYHWVDQAHGIAHIPIDAAMKRIADRGLPDWPGSSATPAKRPTP
jgi:hypothetical protein